MANTKWDCEKTIKFIQLYKLHSCLWNFKSSDYKNKQKRDTAYMSIMQEMNITGFGIQDIKNKIKNLRSTYSQEIKKINESKKSGAGLSNLYTSNIKWLKEMEEVFMNDLNRKTYENMNQSTNGGVGEEQSGPDTFLQSPDCEEVITTNRGTSTKSSTTTATTGNKESTLRAKKRSRDIVKAISDLKTLHEEVNSVEETPFDMFGKDVAMQLKTLSVENALLAQCRIQTTLTEFGIKDYKERTVSNAYMSKYNGLIASPAASTCTDESFNNHTSSTPINFNTSSMIHQFDNPPLSLQSNHSPVDDNNDILTLAFTNALT